MNWRDELDNININENCQSCIDLQDLVGKLGRESIKVSEMMRIELQLRDEMVEMQHILDRYREALEYYAEGNHAHVGLGMLLEDGEKARQALEGKSDWWCPICKKFIFPEHVTFEETHDVRCGGCGNVVI